MMEKFARSLLEKLLDAHERAEAGRRSREAALTKSNLSPYHDCSSLQARETFETVMEAARAERAITFEMLTKAQRKDSLPGLSSTTPRRLLAFWVEYFRYRSWQCLESAGAIHSEVPGTRQRA